MNDLQRDNQVRQWIQESPVEEMLEHENVVMWGVWFSPDSEDCPPPDALFASEEGANAYVAWKKSPECDVSPCIVALVNRNNYDIPESSST